MIFSINECEALICRAARGAGQPIGLGEDLAAAAIWLHAAGIDGLAIAEAALTRDTTTARNLPRLRAMRNGWSLVGSEPDRPLSALHCLSAVIDLVRLGHARQEKSATIVATQVDEPVLLLAAASLGATPDRLPLSVQISGCGDTAGRIVCLRGQTIFSANPLGSIGTAGQPADVMVKQSEAQNSDSTGDLPDQAQRGTQRSIYETGLFIQPKALAGLRALAQNALVPASERSRQLGAGAGALDND